MAPSATTMATAKGEMYAMNLTKINKDGTDGESMPLKLGDSVTLGR